MKCFTKISLVLLSCFSLTKGAVIRNDISNLDLSSFFANLVEQQQTPANNAKVIDVNVNPTNNDDKYTQEDVRKYTKFLLSFVNNDNGVQQSSTTTTTTTTTTTAVATATSAVGVLNDIKSLSNELDQIKERRVDEIDELIDIIKNVSQRLDALEDTVEQSLAKQETVEDTVNDTKEVDLNNAEIDSDTQAISPINENDLKYAAIFNAFNKKNEEKITTMQENEIKLLEEIKELLSKNNANANINVDSSKAIVAADEDSKDKEVKPQAENTNAAPPPETSEETIIEQKNVKNEEFEKLYQEISEDIDDYKKMVSKKNENVSSDEQFTMTAMIRDKTKNIKQHINKLASMAETEEQKKMYEEVSNKYDNVESNHIEKVNNNDEIAKDEKDAKEVAKENAETSSNVISIDHVKKIINEVASSTTNEQQVDEVQRIIKEIQLNEEAQAEAAEKEAKVNEEESVGKALFEVSSNTMNEDQVEEVRKFIKSIEAKAIVDSNLKKDEVVRKLIYDVAANSTNEDQVKEIQRILEKIQLYNKFAEDTQQERKDNLAFGHKMADEIVKSPEDISNDLKVLLVNLANNAKTKEEASNVANIITQIKKHDELIKENEEQKEVQEEASKFIKTPNVESYMIDLDDGSSNQIYLKENQQFIKAADKDEVPVIDLEEGIDEQGNKKGLFVLGAFGVVALAGVGYTYRSKARKLNDEFPFSDSNLPFSNSMNGLVVDKNFLLRKSSIPKPDNIINNDAVIRPSQPSWATSILMDENNKKGLKENVQMTEDPEQLLDEQLREIENKEKVIVKSNLPSVVITIDDDDATINEIAESQKQKKIVKAPKLRRSMSHISLDKKAKKEKEEDSVNKKSRKKKHQKKAHKDKSLSNEKKVDEKNNELEEEKELSLNQSFIIDAPSLLFDDAEADTDNKKNLTLNAEKPKVPKRISSCLEENDILPTLNEEEESKENSECQFSQDFAKELMEDYNKKFDEMEKEN